LKVLRNTVVQNQVQVMVSRFTVYTYNAKKKQVSFVASFKG
jgi:hypothetical protein